MATNEFRVLACGDSVMWGQGLKKEEKFAYLATKQIGALVGRPARLVLHTARSGAAFSADPPKAASDADKNIPRAQQKRERFVDNYPWAFPTKESKDSFLILTNEDATLFLHQELPNTFPTVGYQLYHAAREIPKTLPNESINLLLLNGGGNDLDFEVVLNPKIHRGDFVNYFDSQFEEVFYQRALEQLRYARSIFPNAVIMLTGYYSPVALGVNFNAVKELITHLSGTAGYEVWINDHIIELVDDEQLTVEVMVRGQFALARVIYWSRKLIAEVNKDAELRGPGISFVHPQFGRDNTLFSADSFIFDNYKYSKVKDPAKEEREASCPRFAQLSEMERFLYAIKPPGSISATGYVTKSLVKDLRAHLNGPQTLLDALDKLAKNVADTTAKAKAAEVLARDIGRINTVRIASFIHPNQKGAMRYSEVIAKRYSEWHHNVRLADDIKRLGPAAPKPGQLVSLRAGLGRYGVKYSGSMKSLKQSMTVDSIRLDIVVATTSQKDFIDDVFIDFGNGLKWQLNFPVQVFLDPITNAPFVNKLHLHFEPGRANTFTIDAGATHLSRIAQFILIRKKNATHNYWGGALILTKVVLHVNGEIVFTSGVIKKIERNGNLSFPYPLP